MILLDNIRAYGLGLLGDTDTCRWADYANRRPGIFPTKNKTEARQKRKKLNAAAYRSRRLNRKRRRA